MHRRILISLFIFFILGNYSFSQEIKVFAQLDTVSMLIGDQVEMEMSFSGPINTRVKWPMIPDTVLGNILIIRRSLIDSTFSEDRKSLTLSQKLILTCFDSGFYTIPRIPFVYKLPPDTQQIMATSEIMMLMVHSVQVDTTKAIKPIKGPMKVPLSFNEIFPWILLGLGIVGISLLVVWYLRKRKKKEQVFVLKPRIIQRPWEKAFQELEKLRQKKLWQQGRIKEYHSELTEILRIYLEDHFLIPALESTTGEIMEAMIRHNEVPADSLNALKAILTLADLVKFAKAQPLPDEHEKSLELTIGFIRATMNKEVLP